MFNCDHNGEDFTYYKRGFMQIGAIWHFSFQPYWDCDSNSCKVEIGISDNFSDYPAIVIFPPV